MTTKLSLQNQKLQIEDPADDSLIISPAYTGTTTNRQASREKKLVLLKNFQPAKNPVSSIVTPKYLNLKKSKTGQPT